MCSTEPGHFSSSSIIRYAWDSRQITKGWLVITHINVYAFIYHYGINSVRHLPYDASCPLQAQYGNVNGTHMKHLVTLLSNNCCSFIYSNSFAKAEQVGHCLLPARLDWWNKHMKQDDMATCKSNSSFYGCHGTVQKPLLLHGHF